MMQMTLDLEATPVMDKQAAAMVRNVLTKCLPPGSPISFKKILHARYVGTGRSRMAVGRLQMFDGQPATVEVFKAGSVFGEVIWGHRWTDMPGGSMSLEPCGWCRCGEDGELLTDHQKPRQKATERA